MKNTTNYEIEVFKNQYPIVKRFVYHLIYYRVLSEGYRNRRLQNEFWTLTIDAHLIRATIDWCMVFGSDDKTNQTHWKRIYSTTSKAHQQSFRDGLLSAVGLDQNAWDGYWTNMTDFRNKYVAHRELEFSSPVPDFSKALAIAYYYDSWIRGIIYPDTFAEPTLKSSALSLQKSVAPLVDGLLLATKKSTDLCR